MNENENKTPIELLTEFLAVMTTRAIKAEQQLAEAGALWNEFYQKKTLSSKRQRLNWPQRLKNIVTLGKRSGKLWIISQNQKGAANNVYSN